MYNLATKQVLLEVAYGCDNSSLAVIICMNKNSPAIFFVTLEMKNVLNLINKKPWILIKKKEDPSLTSTLISESHS